MKAAIYARISLDREGEGLGTERQLADCRQLCADRGWTLVEEYVDNDISAFSGRKRPAFEGMLTALANQDFDTVVVWKSDRLARRGRDLQRFLDAAGAATLTSCTEPEFAGSTGLLMLRILSGFAEHESGVKSERVARKMKAKAAAGDPHAGGVRCFGFTATGHELEPIEAAYIRTAAQRVLAGETVSAICTDWQHDGVQTVRGGRWHPSNLARMLRSPRLAGLRELDGQLVVGSWPAILERPAWERLQALLGRRPKHAGRKYLLTGLLQCGRCSARLSGSTANYKCPPKVLGGCGGVGISAAKIEPYVVRTVLASLGEGQRHSVPDDGVEALLEALRGVEAQQAQLGKDYYVDKAIARTTFMGANAELEHRAELLRKQVADRPTTIELGGVVEQWDGRSLSWQQSVLRQVLESVTVLPGRAAAIERVKLHWRA